MHKKVFIVGHKRTPIGGFGGSLSGINAVELGIAATKDLLSETLSEVRSEIDEVYYGNVLSANLGQAPARQVAIGSGLPLSTEATTINKVCSSGMKAVLLGYTSILAGRNKIVLSGGTESMSNVPFYSANARFGNKLGHQEQTDGLLKDGLWDAYHDFHMGNAAEITIKELGISRTEQDFVANRSYKLTLEAIKNGWLKSEIAPVEVKNKKGESSIIEHDEDPFKINYEKVPLLKPTFEKEGTITAANASNLNDGAASLLLADEDSIKKFGLQPLAEIIDYADAAREPAHFSIAPALAINKLLKNNNLQLADIDLFEINEAYASVVIANSRLLNIELENINVMGGAVALGHPIGMSGARIIGRLINTLNLKNKEMGIAAICNGGGGASALCIRKI